MHIKIVGIGKCGIRIAYDFFAYTRDLPSAYDIRLEDNLGKTSGLLEKLGIIKSIRATSVKLRDLIRFSKQHVVYKIAEEPEFITIDSDSANNEVVNVVRRAEQNVVLKIEQEEGDGPENYVPFPGVHFDLDGYTGGCDFHIISEGIAANWGSIPAPITDTASIDVYVTSFSVAGGTGGGSAPTILRYAKDQGQAAYLCHHMGLGVLPKSDEKYGADDTALSMPDYEKFNSGRFMASLYGRRVDDSTDSMDSLWLFSNDVMRFLIHDDTERDLLKSDYGEESLNLSVVNAFIAQSLTVLANSNSVATQADENPDPRELDHKLNRKAFISGVAQARTESGKDIQTVKRLILGALSNIHETNSGLEGLGVPVYEDNLSHLKKILKSKDSDDKTFLSAMENYDADVGPIEFASAERIVLIYGQNKETYSAFKKDRIERVCGRVFPNSQLVYYSFRHRSDNDLLLVLIVDPFVLSVVSSLYYYLNAAWAKSGNLRDQLDSVVETDEFDEAKLSEMLLDAERHSEVVYGAGLTEVMSRVAANDSLELTKEQVIDAVRHIHHIYHRRRPPTDTSSGLGRRKRKMK